MSFKDIIGKYLGISGSKEGHADEDKATYYTTPIAWRDEDGAWVGHNGEVWLYREIPVAPITWEDASQKLAVERPLADMLYELAATSRDTGGLRALSKAREVHLLAVTWETAARPPRDTPERLREFISELLYFTVPARAVLVGVKLWPSLSTEKNIVETAKSRLTSALGESGPDLAQFDADRKTVTEILTRNGGQVPSKRTIAQMESWYNYGRGPDVTVYETKDTLIVGEERLEMAAVMAFNDPIMTAPYDQWGLTAQTHAAPVTIASIRGVLEPSGVSRNRVRRSQRKVLAQIEEEEASGDIERPEQSITLNLAQEVERFILTNREPLVSDCSILLGRRVQPGVFETYVDELRNLHSIEVKPLEHRQMAALEETLPTSSRRVNPFGQDLSIGMLAYAGFQGFSTLGDRRGAYLGLVDPDYTPFYLDFLGAPAANRPPGLLIAGDPGSGKAMPLHHRILTPNGWTTMGELSVGDQVIGADGAPHAVVGVYPQGEIPVYRVRFSDGSHADCCEDHLWAVRRSCDAARGKDWRVMSLGEILQAGLKDSDGKRRWHIPMVQPVQFEEKDLPVDPYLVGVLLGDGNLTHRVGVTSADEEIVKLVRATIPASCELVHYSSYDDAVVRHDCGGQLEHHTFVKPGRPEMANTGQRHGRQPQSHHPLQGALTQPGMSGTATEQVAIPAQYKLGSVHQRVALLQGLMDTDGDVTRRGLVFNTSSEQLAADVVELVQLLGGTAKVTSRIPKYRHNGELREGQKAYRLAIRLPEQIAPFRLSRKRVIWEAVRRTAPVRTIVAVEKLGAQQAQCIAVDAPDCLYVADQGVVTHNTFLASLLAIQSTLAGLQTIFVNPKPSDSLAPMAHYAGGRVVKLTEIESQGGFFDPFRFVPQTPEGAQVAADIAAQHILAVLGSRGVGGLGFNQEQEIALIAGLREGASRGARCVAQALTAVPDQQVQHLVRQQAADPLFRLGISLEPVQPYQGDQGMLLVEFDRPLDIPEKGISPAEYTRTQRLAIAAVRLVTRASLEILAGRQGGVLIVDEAWMYLQSSEGLAALQSLGRMGRSQNILPVFATQRVDDLLREGADMEGYLSRVFALQLNDDREAKAALKLVGLEATEGRINWLKQAGPRRGEVGRPGRPAMGLHRDLHGRHAAVMFGPVPEHVRLAISTNPEDRRKRDAQGNA